MNTVFEWDSEKAKLNLAKHGISFDEASHVFNDPNHIAIQDRFENGEYRWQTIGFIECCLIVLVAHTSKLDDSGEIIRIISARKATKKERVMYEQNNY
ncbi:BrnT family toxin [Providencia hangzhouensis]|uniref:BrnT family toxin n=1 Tax=Providencia hangzhouensis TaxID=3031799 RepID=UPI0034DD1480